MRYFPILEELFESDSILFFVIGLLVTMNIALRAKKEKRKIIFVSIFLVSIVLYLNCEVIAGFAASYLLELIALIIGTMSLGSASGVLLGLILARLFQLFRNAKEDE